MSTWISTAAARIAGHVQGAAIYVPAALEALIRDEIREAFREERERAAPGGGGAVTDRDLIRGAHPFDLVLAVQRFFWSDGLSSGYVGNALPGCAYGDVVREPVSFDQVSRCRMARRAWLVGWVQGAWVDFLEKSEDRHINLPVVADLAGMRWTKELSGREQEAAAPCCDDAPGIHVSIDHF